MVSGFSVSSSVLLPCFYDEIGLRSSLQENSRKNIINFKIFQDAFFSFFKYTNK